MKHFKFGHLLKVLFFFSNSNKGTFLTTGGSIKADQGPSKQLYEKLQKLFNPLNNDGLSFSIDIIKGAPVVQW